MQLRNLSMINSEELTDILIVEEKIVSLIPSATAQAATGDLCIEFDRAIVFPGLINSHDHLDFNLFPPLRNRIYENYASWGKDIHAQNKEAINAVLKIPKAVRIQWGIYKNLLNGVTTVVNHGKKLEPGNELITVFEDAYSLHSVEFEKCWRFKLNKPRRRHFPLVVHVGEGTDEQSKKEIDRLIRWNIFKKEIIAVHGVAMNEKQAAHFKALVWCPASNFFFLERTAAIAELKKNIPILFGTDSTLTSGWNAWEHLRLARKQMMMSDQELFESMTAVPADIWKLPHIGKIEVSRQADLVVAKNASGAKPFDGFFALNPEDLLLVLHRGQIRIFDSVLFDQLTGSGFEAKNFSRIYINQSCKYVQGNIAALMETILHHHPKANLPFNC